MDTAPTYEEDHIKGHKLVRVEEAALHAFVCRVLTVRGVSETHAAQVATVLLASDRRGIVSHGISRLPLYCSRIDVGKDNPQPEVQVVKDFPSAALVDGDRGPGMVAGTFANQLAIDKAKKTGTAWVMVRNSNHYGIAGFYPMEAARHGLIGMSMTNTTACVVPLWGAVRRLGTNPIAAAFPTREGPPVVVDMSTSTVTYGEMEVAKLAGRSVPQGWGVDVEGRHSEDPQAVLGGGGLLPLGGTREFGGHKGYCLAFLVDVMSGVLPGAGYGPFTPTFPLYQQPLMDKVGNGIGHAFGAFDPEAFGGLDAFKDGMSEFVQTLRDTRPAPGQEKVLIPGDPEKIREEQTDRLGVAVLEKVYEALQKLATDSQVEGPPPPRDA